MRIALVAGRRVDEAAAPRARFPLSNVHVVAQRLRMQLRKHQIGHVISSAACGADLIAQEIARSCDLERTIVLPFEVAHFRQVSVIDRPGEWGASFDRLISASSRLNVINLNLAFDSKDAFVAVNEAIIAAGLSLSGGGQPWPVAFIVWDGVSRGSGDLTAHFRHLCVANDVQVVDIETL